MVPIARLRTATYVSGTLSHSWQAISSSGSSIEQKGMINASKTISLTAMQLMTNPDVLIKAKEELINQRGLDFVYKPLLADRELPLDYRN